MNRLDRILFDTDPSGILLLAFVLAIALLVLGRIAWLTAWAGWHLLRAGLQGRRERLARERARRARPGPNWLAADLRRRRAGAGS